jgi:DNA helicase HerA-like ATPase
MVVLAVERHALLSELVEDATKWFDADVEVLREILLLPGAALEEGLVDAGEGFGLAALPHGGMIGAVAVSGKTGDGA